MNIAEVKQELRGLMVPVLTHDKCDVSIDRASIRENIRAISSRSLVRGQEVLPAGGAGGCFPKLTLEETKQMSKTIFDAADGHTPVGVGAQDTNVSNSIVPARCVEEIGAYGIQFSAKYYYQANRKDHLASLRNRT